jgi:hypothetical protein
LLFRTIPANLVCKGCGEQKQSEEKRVIEKFGTGIWKPLNREQAWVARDFSRAGETFIDYNGQVNEILYSILSPLGYQVQVSAQKLLHVDRHPIASKHKDAIAHILNNPDLVTPDPERPEVHIFYKSFYGNKISRWRG